MASIEARSQGFRFGDVNLVVVDEVQARWIHALCLARETSRSNIWPIYVLFHYLVLRLVASGLPREARLLSDSLRTETRLVDRDRGFDTASAGAETSAIEKFIRGHELGHVAYKHGGADVGALLQTVHACTDDLTRLLRATFSGDRSLLTEQEQDPRYEDITLSMKDYINRFVFHERSEDIVNIERDLLSRGDARGLQARLHRFEAFADIFERVDFLEEAFCDIYALEFRLLEAEGVRTLAEDIAREWWANLHAMFALAAMDSLTRDRRVAAQVHVSKKELFRGVVLDELPEAEVEALYQQVEEIEATREADRARLFYQVSMIKVVYRRVALMNYMERHPLLDRLEFLLSLKEEGEKLEQQFLGAGATLRFNLMRLEMEHQAGFGDTLDPAEREDLDRLWADIVVRVPAMDQLTDRPMPSASPGAPPGPRYNCAFCGFDVAETRLVVTSGRVSICDQCAFVAGAAFAAMPEDHPRRPTVKWSIMLPPPTTSPERADPSKPHCQFCEMAPAANEPLVTSQNGTVICAYCAEGALALVRRKSPASDPDYICDQQASYERWVKLAEGASSSEFTEIVMGGAQAALDNIERARNPIFPGREMWRLFTEPTAQPNLPCASAA
ncbi:hypothetical protein EJC47_18435 [Sphingomonas sp. TF3]|nr:hypothetical protein EJC47_18435 [Sphingomonas sp. TF3]